MVLWISKAERKEAGSAQELLRSLGKPPKAAGSHNQPTATKISQAENHTAENLPENQSRKPQPKTTAENHSRNHKENLFENHGRKPR